jgi:hypothetical protein
LPGQQHLGAARRHDLFIQGAADLSRFRRHRASGQFQFSAGGQSSFFRMTLAEAVADAGGLLDLQADPGSVFLFRRQPHELAEKLGVNCSMIDGPTVPIIYQSASSMFSIKLARPGPASFYLINGFKLCAIFGQA